MATITLTDIPLDQWIDLGAIGCKSITARAMREPPAPPPVEEEDMPLHSAVYDPTRDFIFAVRGGRVFKLNATTGAKISEFQYAGPTLSDSYIAYDAGRDKLWVTYSPSFAAPPGNTSPTNDEYIFKLNPSTLAVQQTIGVGANTLSQVNFDEQHCNNVIRNLISNGIQLAYVYTKPQVSNGFRMVVFNPDSLPGNVFSRINTTARWGFLQVHPGGAGTDYLYVDDDSYNDGVTRRTNANVFVESGGGYPVIGNNALTKRIYGFAYVASNNKHYCANRSNLILKLDASSAAVGSAIDVGGIDIWNIRRNAADGLLYAADFGGNKIIVINPTTDAFFVKTGFDAPWDVVFTPTKRWAVQHGTKGLKEIT